MRKSSHGSGAATEPVAAAVEEAIELVSRLVRDFLEKGTIDGWKRFDVGHVATRPAEVVQSSPREPLH